MKIFHLPHSGSCWRLHQTPSRECCWNYVAVSLLNSWYISRQAHNYTSHCSVFYNEVELKTTPCLVSVCHIKLNLRHCVNNEAGFSLHCCISGYAMVRPNALRNAQLHQGRWYNIADLEIIYLPISLTHRPDRLTDWPLPWEDGPKKLEHRQLYGQGVKRLEAREGMAMFDFFLVCDEEWFLRI